MSLVRLSSLESRLFDHAFATFDKRTLACGCITREFSFGEHGTRATRTTTRHCITHARPGEYRGPEPYESKHPAATTADEEAKRRLHAMCVVPESSREGLLEMVNRAPNGTFERKQRPCKCIMNQARVWLDNEDARHRYGSGLIEPCHKHAQKPLSSL
jgi:hypothetical protein